MHLRRRMGLSVLSAMLLAAQCCRLVVDVAWRLVSLWHPDVLLTHPPPPKPLTWQQHQHKLAPHIPHQLQNRSSMALRTLASSLGLRAQVAPVLASFSRAFATGAAQRVDAGCL